MTAPLHSLQINHLKRLESSRKRTCKRRNRNENICHMEQAMKLRDPEE